MIKVKLRGRHIKLNTKNFEKNGTAAIDFCEVSFY
jgi:hypothetical protein